MIWLLFIGGLTFAGPDSALQARFSALMAQAQAQRLEVRPFGEILQAVGLWFQGAPYVAGLLDEAPVETLLTPLDRFDCVLFVESVLALAQTIALGDTRMETFQRRVEALRYRDGRLGGYCTRLHYFTDWIDDNARRGMVRDITQVLGGKLVQRPIAFMSTHRMRYPKLQSDSTWQCLRAVETALSQRKRYVLSKSQVRQISAQLQAGDIVALVAREPTLDVVHVGLVYVGPNGRRGLLHASPQGGVKVSPDLQTYLQNNRSSVGIVVARPIDPRHP
ncbi:N-acetylmuramoyl-L-alanine amidase-like domain-containing protein [Rhodothermus bifroesti]|uniref:N-acetylmuramoyl-L-alanine amidase-like domain-containing protein n=1 Tax=Rhodothermus bifroesti TaxID=2823335 RepID=UPI001AF017B8|nr:N-acetylmuramoyl-L-alanine amidase-like domain-containing protein [Rhodothermus bifroesti]